MTRRPETGQPVPELRSLTRTASISGTARVSGEHLTVHKAIPENELTRQIDPANLPATFTEIDEAIRVLLRTHLPHGTKIEIAHLAGIHLNQLSRQLSGDDGLHNRVVGAALFVLRRYPELHAVITAVEILRSGKSSTEIRTRMGLVIEFKSGQLALPGMDGEWSR